MNAKSISLTGGFLLLSFLPSVVSASGFDALCPIEKCRVVLSPNGISVGSEVLPLNRVTSWDTHKNTASPSSALNTGKGALVGGLTGAALLGPVGLVAGAVWGGSEESGGNVHPDLAFEIRGLGKGNQEVVHRVRFINHGSARRFRMEMPMFTGLRPGERRLLDVDD